MLPILIGTELEKIEHNTKDKSVNEKQLTTESNEKKLTGE